MIRSGGIGTYLRGLIPRIMEQHPDWHYSLLGNPDVLRAAAPRAALIRCDAPIYSIAEQWALARTIPADTSVFWAPHYNVPLFCRAPIVVTVHDLAHLRLPEYGGVRRAYATAMFQYIRRRAAAVVFVSDFTRSEFQSLVGRSFAQTETIYGGLLPDLTSFDPSAPPPAARPYLVYVGNSKPHKNLGTLLDAFADVRRTIEVRLVMIGQTTGLRTRDDRNVERLRAAEGVVVLGAVTDADLRSCIAQAAALVLPSVYEGFGLPPLEAMALGCPAIVARAASLPEICGDAALFFDPLNPAELAAAMRRMLTDEAFREDLVQRGHDRAGHFSLDEGARRIGVVLGRSARPQSQVGY